MDDRIDKIHQASLHILERTGMVFHDREITAALLDRGVRVDGKRAFFRPDQVMTWVSKAPKQFTLHARNPVHNLVVGGDRTAYAAGYGCPAVVGADGARRQAVFEDYLRFAGLVQQMDCFHINGGILVEPQDIPVQHRRALMVYSTILLSDKALFGVSGRPEDVVHSMELAAIVWGGRDALCRQPAVLTLVNTISPLQLDAGAAAAIRTCAALRQPVIVSPGPMSGATGPVTLAGNIALGNAEALAVIAVCQMLQPGLPVLYGLQATTADPRTGGVAIGSPGFSVQTAWCARLAKFYGLPARAGGAATDAGQASMQSGYESMLSLLVSRHSGIHLVVHAAGILAGYAAMSYDQFLVDAELIRMVEYVAAGLEVDDNTLALDVIDRVGPAGEYLTQPHTAANCRRSAWQPGPAASWGDAKDWDKRFFEGFRARGAKLLESYVQPPLDAHIKTGLDAYLTGLGVASEQLSMTTRRWQRQAPPWT